jgi:phage terminase small subunit
VSVALNVRQQRFVEGVLAGMPAKRAYISAGYKARGNAAETAAARLFRNVQVAAAIDAANAAAATKAEITAEWVIGQLREEATRHGAGSTHAARVRALELLGKRLGLFPPDRHEVSGPAGAAVVCKVYVADDNFDPDSA